MYLDVLPGLLHEYVTPERAVDERCSVALAFAMYRAHTVSPVPWSLVIRDETARFRRPFWHAIASVAFRTPPDLSLALDASEGVHAASRSHIR